MHKRLFIIAARCLAFSVLLFAILSPFVLQARQAAAVSARFAYQPSPFAIAAHGKAAGILIETGMPKLLTVAATALQGDIKDISGATATIEQQLPQKATCIVIIGIAGQSAWLNDLILSGKLSVSSLKGKWESFSLSVIDKPFPGIQQALVVAGSDARGAAFGVFELSRRMGVSPWKWWADVAPARHASIYITPGLFEQGPPSVKYRGIFLNDEDWGLQPWAAKKMDTVVKDIGPYTYTRIFELLLRLKANYIWPAMHPSTKAFYYYTHNPRIANDYGIVVGSSHCEPMLRNNVFEWAENYRQEYGKLPGEWRYDLNREQIFQYWNDRVLQSVHYQSVYTVGMRGIHDGSMPGPKSIPEKVKLLQQVIEDQRQLLALDIAKAPESIPQIFCPYKELLTLYRNGLRLPEDVTIVWEDDNYGYIRQLSNAQERQRSGSSGVYYHLSYWGSPQDYLWLSSTSPALLSYEMSRAWHYGADRVWIFNVGDIKPAEMEIQFAMDLAWNVQHWPPEKAAQYIKQWAAETFGEACAPEIGSIKNTYYELAQAAKPEHLGLVRFRDEEAVLRLSEYTAIAGKVERLYKRMPAHLKDAFFELILYPVESARLMNEKILYAKKSLQLAAAGDKTAPDYSRKAEKAFAAIQSLTAKYNDSIAGGKWSGIMSWHPRNLPVFNMPPVATLNLPGSSRALQVANHPAKPAGGKRPIIMHAAAYESSHTLPGFSFSTIRGPGLHGSGVTLRPFSTEKDDDTSFINKPFLEYNVQVSEGKHTVWVKCLPGHDASGRGRLRYAVSINGDTPQVVNINAEAESSNWKENVLPGYAAGQSAHTITQPGPATIRIYWIDKDIVINTIEIE
jgi:hypothetical protein